MNKVFKVIWNVSLDRHCVASELANSAGKCKTSVGSKAKEKSNVHTPRSFKSQKLKMTLALAAAFSPALTCADVRVTGEVNPAGSSTPVWTVPGAVTVGDTAQGTLDISDGSAVHNGAFESFVGKQAGSAGAVTVTGPGSEWIASTGTWIVNVGYYGSGALAVEDGASFKAGQLWLGRFADSTGSAVFRGSDTRGLLNAQMYVGLWGTGSLELLDGAQLKGYRAQIGTEAGSVGNALVSGVNTRWDIDDYFTVGNKGAGSLRIEDGAVVSVASNSTELGVLAMGSGSVTVSGTGSQLNNNGLYVGKAGLGSLLVENSGATSATTVYVGATAGARGAVEVTGADSRLTSDYLMAVGYRGAGALRIADGAVVTSPGPNFFGFLSGSTGQLELTDKGSRFDSNSTLYAGYESDSEGQINILNGAALTSGEAVLGEEGTGGVHISGEGSSWQVGRILAVGSNGNGAVVVDNGGALKSDTVLVGHMAGSNGQIRVSGEGSSWDTSRLYLSGDYNLGTGGDASLTLNDGAIVRADAFSMASGSVGSAVFNIGSAAGEAATAAGTIETPSIVMAGDSTIVFNHTDGNYQFNPAVEGAGNVAVYIGTTVFNASNAYAGTTTVNGGTLRAGALGALSSASDYVVKALGRLDLAGNSQTLASLDNGGVVSLSSLSGAVKRSPSDTPNTQLTVAGDYVGNGGLLEINSKLEGDNSQTDKLIIHGNSSGDTFLKVNNVGGGGSSTLANGIPVVQVDGVSNGVFTLAGRVVVGSHEYLLAKGAKDNPQDGDWYLRSELPVETPQSIAPTAPIDPVSPSVTAPEAPAPNPSAPSVYRPEIGAYLGNRLAVIGMFQHTLHERVGESDFSETSRSEGANPGAVWMRVKRNQFTADTGARQIDVDTATDIVQVGADLARWMEGDSQYRVGVMVGTGKANTGVKSNVLGYKAKGVVDGTSVGVYGTWYQNATEPTGAYVDSSLQFGRYDNSVKGDGLPRENYDSKTWSASLETGYAFEVGRGESRAYYVEPQAQVIYTRYTADKHREQNGTVVKSDNAGDVTTRLGARAYARPTDKSGVTVQPFVEGNWLRSDGNNAMSFNDSRARLDGAKNLYEVKLGAEADLGKGWSGFGHLGKQIASGSQQDVAGQMGVKYSW